MATDITPQTSIQPVQIQQAVVSPAVHVVPAPAKSENASQENTSNTKTGQSLPASLQKAEQENKVSQEELQEAVSKIKDHIQNIQRDLQFNIDDYSGQTVVKVIDSETEKVIRQIPSEEILELHEQLDKVAGLLLKEEA